MNYDITFFTLFLLGFFGGTHCVGMCGGLSSAFALQLPPHLNRLGLIVLLNLGRLSSYVLIGLIVGLVGQIGISLDDTRWLQNGLYVAANVLLLLLGLYLAGLSTAATQIERIGRPIWKRLNPILNRLLPIKSVPACFGVGMLWGWLPCGLVYSASLYALGSGNAVQGGLYMLAFALGTLPNLLAMGIFAAQLKTLLQRRAIRLCAGLLVAGWAVFRLAVML
ncbi:MULTISPECIES: sulfite exporter TauE/SafE family protein [Neisseria]|jgi:putative membrane protein|uniref:Sulfite exporter TauE/SafE family protein n=1 Tax=Neisseria macacae ATCC 33926 TaxID=997348 RepID=A0AA36XL99_9NEIS|nr:MULTISPECIES: sulfite exporter TauE/SafE family protein [Neisseria]EGQ77792.1 TRAP transporter, DctM family membrane protein [Neisseria macacae ATCC 33926]UNV85452.1 sulfite exporter TauE/SafE family protein [Neisseria macacae ATCC 33926]